MSLVHVVPGRGDNDMITYRLIRTIDNVEQYILFIYNYVLFIVLNIKPSLSITESALFACVQLAILYL